MAALVTASEKLPSISVLAALIVLPSSSVSATVTPLTGFLSDPKFVPERQLFYFVPLHYRIKQTGKNNKAG